MSYPPNGPPPPYYGPGYWPPPPMHPYPGPPPHPHHGPHHGMHGPPGPPMPYFVPATMMVPVPLPADQAQGQPTYITNYYYGESSQTQLPPPEPEPVKEEVKVVESSGDFDWVPTTATLANTLTGRAVVGGHEGWDGSPLWVIRSHINGEIVPGKLSVRHNSATISYNGKEVPVQNIEVLCANVESLRWIPASNGAIPPSAIPGGHTNGEPLYIGRANYQISLTPGKVHPSHGSCYITFQGSSVAMNTYDVLCRAS